MNAVIESGHATFRAEPDHGRPVVFEVRVQTVNVATASGWYSKNMQSRYVVGLKGSSGAGFAHFVSFEKACRSALARARKYERAYSKPRGIVPCERPRLAVVASS